MLVSKVTPMPVDSYGDIRTLVRGITYQCPNDWKDILDSLNEDSVLYLIKEPDNPKDPLAIAAYLDDRRVGYVAASDNEKIWLYLTDEKMPCTFIERFDASFKIAFENPRVLFEDLPFKEIYKDNYGVAEEPYASFNIPFLTNPKDKNYDWYDDMTYIMDLEKFIPDFRRKLAARLILLVGRKNSKGEYFYYLPYANNPVSEIKDSLIKRLIERYGFVIALPDVPMIKPQGGIFMDLHVTFIKNTNYKDFELAHKSELVFSIVRDYDNKKQIAEVTQSTASSKNNPDVDNNIVNEDNYMYFQEPQSTPSYSKSDYIFKKGEKKKSIVTKKYFNEIDKITNKLYYFVKQNLLPSIELFGFIKNHTPYAIQFNDFKQYETLIKIFVIKDLGRIYKGLNLSFNFATKEGKPLLLYMKKDVSDDHDTSFEMFKEICNPKTQLEPAKKMHEVIEDLTRTYYEFDINLWTNKDLMIHSLLKDVNKDLANSYLQLMNEFASTIKGTNKEMPNTSKRIGAPTSFSDDFFPLFGVTLGKTTWEQAENMGYKIEAVKDSQMRRTKIGNVNFWDDEGVGIFTSLSWYFYSFDITDFPISWKSKGFSWKLSYDEWMDVFRKLEFKITVNEQPSQEEFSGHNTLRAEFEALSPDGRLLFTLYFDYGEEGYYTSSPKTLHKIDLEYKATVKEETDQKEFAQDNNDINEQASDSSKHTLSESTAIIKEFFPLFGVTLGKTTWKQVEDMGYKVDVMKDSQTRNTHIGDVTFWDDEGVGIFTSLSWLYNSDDTTDFPNIWKSKGFSWDLSYDEWMDVFRKLGFKITVNQQPSLKEYLGRNTLHAEFEALSSDGRLLFMLYFDFGEEGHETSSPRTLFHIDLDYEVPVKEETDQKESASDDKDTNEHISNIPNNASKESSIIGEFFPLFGITLGETTCKQVEEMGNKVEVSEGSQARYTEVGGVHFWDDEGVGVLTSLYWFYHYIDFPSSWKSKGFSWDNSYDEWIDVFKKMGFNITVTKKPSIGEFCGSETLSAKFEALSPDGKLLFKMTFDNGEDGCYTSSQKALDTISVICNQIETTPNKPTLSEKKDIIPSKEEHTEEYYSVTDSPEGGKHVSMGVVVPEEGDKDFDFCTYNCYIDDKENASIITNYMKRFEEGKESVPFLMIGRPCFGLDNIDIFYSLDGNIIFDFIWDEKIKKWIREAGFVLGKVKEYHSCAFPEGISLTLSVSKRKKGEKLFNKASEEAMDFIVEKAVSIAGYDVEEKIIKATEDYKKGNSSPYQVMIIPKNGIGACTTIDGDEIAIIINKEIINLSENNKGAIGYITDIDYAKDDNISYVWFTIKVSRSIPRVSLD